ncbi:hypothetical protein U737_10305 [Methylomonas sp. LW13]|uniref:P-loop ATPase, Sll1717 family n=1 Tax=unclassified Methylomonas TaxID=2608980 RepID=UPI00051AFE4C|nr:hypothetical protein [Methylomonas sp. LW13]QBC27264.1 hypothetical protein U737_10305 [Methylomonas sp. LW13]
MDNFVFRKHDNVGAAAAEHDSQFLDDCFVDTGDIKFLFDRKNPKRIIVGRTGAGKTALLYHLAHSNNNVVELSPHDLSLNFIATNKVLAFFEEAGVNLSPFYVLLWKHLLVVELIKAKFKIKDEASYKTFMRTISSIIRKKDRNKELAIDYFETWGNKFWLTTEQRIHELTSRVEQSLTAGVNGKFSNITFNAEGAKKLSVEQRAEVKEHGLDAVSKVQIRELENMLTVLEDNIFDDEKRPYYVTIDMLDEDWADDRIKFKLIRSLIDVVNRFKQLSNVKVVLAIRHDLLYKVLHLETIAGFQEEKYKALYLNLKWEKSELEKIVQYRINKLIKHHYTKGDVSFKDVFPAHVDTKDTFDYMLERTFFRPRDIIVFVNECLELCTGKPRITATIIKEAENNYSAERLQSLSNEWSIILPDLMHTSRLLYGLKDHFEVRIITQDFLAGKFEEIVFSLNEQSTDPITKSLYSLYSAKSANFDSVRNYILREFYAIGLIGIKTGPTDSTSWTRTNNLTRLEAGQIRPTSTVFIHPMFFRALGVRL